MLAQQEKIKAALAKLQEAKQILESVEWTPAQVASTNVGNHLRETENKLDTAFGRMSSLFDSCSKVSAALDSRLK